MCVNKLSIAVYLARKVQLLSQTIVERSYLRALSRVGCKCALSTYIILQHCNTMNESHSVHELIS